MTPTDPQLGKERYGFGPFQVDAEREVLYREGEPVALTPKTFQILLVLLRHGTEIVSKDELMKAVWPDTFVEEANLSRNIFMLRKALGESAGENRYIVTVPGRGYRLAEKTHELQEQQEVSIIAAQRSNIQVQVTETWPRWAITLAAGAVIAVAALAAWLWWPRPKLLGAKDKVLLADFVNSTGDAVFDGALRQGLAIQLEQSPYLSLVSDERIQNTLRQMGQPAGAPVAAQVAKELCNRAGATAALSGSIARLGSQYVLGLRAVDCRTGDLLDEEQAQAPQKEQVLNALSDIASRFRKRVGESLAAVAQHEKPLAEATTPSLEALKAFSNGVGSVSTSPTEAVAFFKRAIELDPNFAIAYAWLARQYGDMNEFGQSEEMARKAYELRERASDPEKFWIMAGYETEVTENMERAAAVCDVWAKTYPRDPVPDDMLAGIVYPVLGKYEAALAKAREAVGRDPDFGVSYAILTARYRNTGNIAEAQRTVQEAAARKVVRPETTLEQYNLAFLNRDASAMQQAIAVSQQDPVTEEWVAESAAMSAAYIGQLRQARSWFAHAEHLAEEGGRRESSLYIKPPRLWWKAGTATRLKRGQAPRQRCRYPKTPRSSMARRWHSR